MRKVEYWIEESFGIPASAQENLLASVVLLVCLWVISRVIHRLAAQRQTDSRKLYQWQKTTNYVVTGFGIVFLANIWFNGFESIATFLGLLSVGLVVALREPILSMFGWIFLLWKRPFKIGDRIKINGHTGDVIDIGLFQFTLNELSQTIDSEQPTGHVVHLPNSMVFSQSQINYNYGFPFLWHEVQVAVTFESNWERARTVLEDIVDRHSEKLSESAQEMILRESQRHLIFYKDFKARVFVKARENGIQFTLRYLCALNRRRESENLIWTDVFNSFLNSPDIKFAYPTTRFYQQPEERLHNAGEQV
ncbi:mechanosensitive ion channel family protein [Pontibacter akesuensis]|uniref:Small-conductance mechanosensitive channel n=1 Tax=Pontibacter akesuensis TaxID=388950 RepID=A0A1I7HU27_9BACT|nr:mechanosensitive ion channel domain-containing protein [Pontibacter akesuensis]GHA63551.1 mechanosensitive ion channel protein MscS [Pontibacter akesuensis]SFU64167.1 Small-conductance mechanosensitive channel [Pontibacter akesuensis]